MKAALVALGESGQLDLLQKMITAARDLNEPGEINQEYVRGQGNLIFDTIMWPGPIESDHAYEWIEKAITHRISFWVMIAEILDYYNQV